MTIELTSTTAAGFARITLEHLGQQYPYKPDLVMEGPQDARPPIEFHPVFHGSFDWHSCVHGWWQVLRLLRAFPNLEQGARIRARADEMLVPAKIAGELAFLTRASSAGFERPYGWAWLLALHHEACLHDAGWSVALDPLARAFAARLHDFLPRLTYPIRVGTHANTAFSLILAREWAIVHDPVLAAQIDRRALDWFGKDADCQAWEPSGDDFLSSALTEAVLMCRIAAGRGPGEAAKWFDAFLPRAAFRQPASLFTPAHVSDRRDGKIAHLDGLNLSRAWCWRSLASILGESHPIHSPALSAADAHLKASIGHLADDYMGSHWLATFALLALNGETRSR